MTNAELLDKIKAEIERLCDEAPTCDDTIAYLMKVECFLDTLESEKTINLDDAMKELDEKIALVKERGTWDGVDVDKYMDEIRGREPEKPMNLEEEINRYLHEECSNDDEPGIHEIAEHFAEWGYLRAAEKYNEIEYNRQRAEESGSSEIPNDLEEAAKAAATEVYTYTFQGMDDLIGLFKAGAEWQAEKDARDMYMSDNRHFEKVYQLGKKDMEEQMMKEAVDFTLEFTHQITLPRGKPGFGNIGDKIRVIVLPKED